MAWYDNDWKYRVGLAVSSSKVDATLSSFPVYVDLNDFPGDFFSNVKSDGSDIVVTSSDGTTKLKRELVAITTGSSTGELWFQAPSLSSSANTQFYIYFGNSAASESNDSDIWPTEYKYVAHFEGDSSDSSQSSQTISNESDTTYGTDYGQMGQGVDMAAPDGDSGFTIGTTLMNTPSSGLIQGWVNVDTDGSDGANAWDRPSFWSKDNVYISFIRTAADGTLRAYYYDTGGTGRTTDSTGDVPLNTWTHVAVRWNSSNLYIYIDGSLDTTSSADITFANVNAGHANEAEEFARRGGTPRAYPIDGSFDEWHFIKGDEKSDAWVAASYNNQKTPGTFYSVGSAENILQASTILSLKTKYRG